MPTSVPMFIAIAKGTQLQHSKLVYQLCNIIHPPQSLMRAIVVEPTTELSPLPNHVSYCRLQITQFNL